MNNPIADEDCDLHNLPCLGTVPTTYDEEVLDLS